MSAFLYRKTRWFADNSKVKLRNQLLLFLSLIPPPSINLISARLLHERFIPFAFSAVIFHEFPFFSLCSFSPNPSFQSSLLSSSAFQFGGCFIVRPARTACYLCSSQTIQDLLSCQKLSDWKTIFALGGFICVWRILVCWHLFFTKEEIKRQSNG